MSRSKSQHYVPRWLLKRFCSSGENLFYYSDKEAGRGVQLRNVRTTFRGFHINSVRFRDGRTLDLLEQEVYGPLDDGFSKLADEIDAAFASGSWPDLRSCKGVVAQMIYNQTKRSTEFLSSLEFVPRNIQQIEGFLSKFEDENGPLSSEERQEFLREESVREHIDWVRTVALAQQTPRVLEILSTRFEPILAVPPCGKQFIVSGWPVAGFGVLSKGREFWMPLGSRLVLGLVEFGWRGSSTPTLTREQVRTLNVAWRSQSKSFGGADKNLVESLVSPR